MLISLALKRCISLMCTQRLRGYRGPAALALLTGVRNYSCHTAAGFMQVKGQRLSPV